MFNTGVLRFKDENIFSLCMKKFKPKRETKAIEFVSFKRKLKGLGQQQGFVSSEEEAAFCRSSKSTDTKFEFGVFCSAKKFLEKKWHLPQFNVSGNIFLIKLMDLYRGADKSLARPGRKQSTATEDFYFDISYL